MQLGCSGSWNWKNNGLTLIKPRSTTSNNGRQRLKVCTVKKKFASSFLKMSLFYVAFMRRKSHLLPYFSPVYTMFRFLDLLVLVPASELHLPFHFFTLPYRRHLEVYQRPVLMSNVLVLVLSCYKFLQLLTALYCIWPTVCLENIF